MLCKKKEFGMYFIHFSIFIFSISSLLSAAMLPARTALIPQSNQKPVDYFILLADNGKILIADPATFKLINEKKFKNSYDQIKKASGSQLPLSTSMNNVIKKLSDQSLMRLTFIAQNLPVMQVTINKDTKKYIAMTTGNFISKAFPSKFMQIISEYAPAAPENIMKMSSNQKVEGNIEKQKKIIPVVAKPVISSVVAGVTKTPSIISTAQSLVKSAVQNDAFLEKVKPALKATYMMLEKGSVFFVTDKAIAEKKGSMPDLKDSLELTKMISEKKREFLTSNIERAKKALNIMEKESTITLYDKGKEVAKALLSSEDLIQTIICKDDDAKKVVIKQFGTAIKKLLNISSNTDLEKLIVKEK